MLTRTFTDEEDSSAEGSSGEGPEYSFAGFNVEFSEKIALTPAESGAKGAPASSADGRPS